MNDTEKFFIKCVKAGLDGTEIAELPQDLSFSAFYNLCVSHSVTMIVFFALQKVKNSLPPKFYDALKSSVKRHVVKDVQLGIDSETVIDALEKNCVKFMPLKGYYLKKLYPKTEMRYASDSDILIDVKEIKKVRKTVKELGLKIKRYDSHHDILYCAETKSVFELHKKLFVGKLGKYFGVGFEKAKLKDGYKYFYELSPEDFYMTFVAHTAYHFAKEGGAGIRHLADVYVYRKRYKLNEEYLAQEFSKCGLRSFQEKLEKLEAYFFENGDADEFTLTFAEYVLSSTVLGNASKKSASEIAANDSKGKTILKMIFPSLANMKFTYPILNKAVFLLPVFYVVRWFRIIFKNHKNIARIKQVCAVKNEEIKQVNEIRTCLGINNIK